MAVLISPLALVPEEVASVVWVMISFATIFGSLLLCLRVLDVKPGREAWVIGGLTTFAVSRLLDAELGNGQANHLVLLCVALTAWCFARRHRGLAGVALSLAIAFKVTPALLCGYFVWRREWRVLAGRRSGPRGVRVRRPRGHPRV